MFLTMAILIIVVCMASWLVLGSIVKNPGTYVDLHTHLLNLLGPLLNIWEQNLLSRFQLVPHFIDITSTVNQGHVIFTR